MSKLFHSDLILIKFYPFFISLSYWGLKYLYSITCEKNNNVNQMKSVEDLTAYFDNVFSKASRLEFLEIDDRHSLQLSPKEQDLRPGNTISGPVMFEIADCALWRSFKILTLCQSQ